MEHVAPDLLAWVQRELDAADRARFAQSTIMTSPAEVVYCPAAGVCGRQSLRFYVSPDDSIAKLQAELGTRPWRHFALDRIGRPKERWRRLPARMLDLGANLGIITVAAHAFNQLDNNLTWPRKRPAHRCLQGVALEPVPLTFALLRRNLRLNSIAELSIEQLRHNTSACGVLPLNLATTHDRRAVRMVLGSRSMSAHEAGGVLADAVTGGGAQGPASLRSRPRQMRPVQSLTLREALALFDADDHRGGGPRKKAGVSAAVPLVQLVKLDCEGCEHDVVRELSDDAADGGHRLASRVLTIAGELHGCASTKGARRKRRRRGSSGGGSAAAGTHSPGLVAQLATAMNVSAQAELCSKASRHLIGKPRPAGATFRACSCRGAAASPRCADAHGRPIDGCVGFCLVSYSSDC